MKKYIVWILSLAVVLSLLGGCAEQETTETTAAAEATVSLTETSSPEMQIHTTEEFLDSLGSGRTLSLAPCTFDLTIAESGPEDGILHRDERTGALILRGLKDLTILGNGAQILVGGTEGIPLVLEDCSNVTLQDLTLTHGDLPDRVTPEMEIYSGDRSTLVLRRCSGMVLDQVTLWDTVPELLSLQGSEKIRVEACVFKEASASALSVSGCREVTVEDCRIEKLGLGAEADLFPSSMDFRALICIGPWFPEDTATESRDITVRNNTFSDNRSGLLASVDSSRKVSLQDNVFTGNHMNTAAFNFWSSAPHVVGNTFRNNDPWLWYYPSSEMAVDETGAEIPSELFYAEEELPQPGPQREIHVSTAEEFLNAVGPDVKIILDCPLLDLSTAPDYGDGEGPWYRWQEEVDGPMLVISYVSNLTISSQDPDRTAHTISALPRYADVLHFEFCNNLTLENLTCGHTVEPGFCMGGVLHFKGCRNTTVKNCGLYGCGILGITAHGGENLRVLDSDIYECSQGGVSLISVGGVTIENTTFRDLGGEALYVSDCRDATIDGEPISQR